MGLRNWLFGSSDGCECKHHYYGEWRPVNVHNPTNRDSRRIDSCKLVVYDTYVQRVAYEVDVKSWLEKYELFIPMRLHKRTCKAQKCNASEETYKDDYYIVNTFSGNHIGTFETWDELRDYFCG